MDRRKEQIVSVCEAEQDFARVARLADRVGTVYLYEDGKPRYQLVNLREQAAPTPPCEGEAQAIAKRVLETYLPAFRELAQ